MLQNSYYSVINQLVENNHALFIVSLNSKHPVYRGHFPEKPVSPGVCNIQMIKECAEILIGKPLFLNNLVQCRFLEVITPENNPKLYIRIQFSEKDNVYKVVASVMDLNGTLVELKGDFSEIN